MNMMPASFNAGQGAPASSARFSRDGRYRYSLSRYFGDGPTAIFTMLNPSTADAVQNDPTIRKCIGFCRRWGVGQLHVVNLFAFRAVSPFDMKKADDPIGPLNRRAVERALTTCEDKIVVCAWGVHGGFMKQDHEMIIRIGQISAVVPLCLGTTKDGFPRHPIYLPYRASLIPYRGR